jgi:hypothetical protein
MGSLTGRRRNSGGRREEARRWSCWEEVVALGWRRLPAMETFDGGRRKEAATRAQRRSAWQRRNGSRRLGGHCTAWRAWTAVSSEIQLKNARRRGRHSGAMLRTAQRRRGEEGRADKGGEWRARWSFYAWEAWWHESPSRSANRRKEKRALPMMTAPHKNSFFWFK